MFQNDLEEWEKAHVNALTLRMIFLATGGTLLATALAFVLRQTALGEINPELLFIPWGIVLVLGISTAFKKGVEEERARVADAAKTTATAAPAAKKATTKKRKTTRKKAAVKTVTAKKVAAPKKPAAKKPAKKKTAAKKTATAKKAAPKKTGAAKKATTRKKTTAKK